jgi:hypothetical protein
MRSASNERRGVRVAQRDGYCPRVAQSQIEVFSNWSLMAGSHPTIECGAGFFWAWLVGSTVFLALTPRVRKLSITGPVVAIAAMDILRA